MKNLIIILIVLIAAQIGFGQELSSDSTKINYGTIDENFIGGRHEYNNVFYRQLEYPYEYRELDIVGTVFFEIEIDTNGLVINTKILRGVTEWMDKQVEDKLSLTNGYWKPLIKNGKKVNYNLRSSVYFELR